MLSQILFDIAQKDLKGNPDSGNSEKRSNPKSAANPGAVSKFSTYNFKEGYRT